jgi:hypothetical protein
VLPDMTVRQQGRQNFTFMQVMPNDTALPGFLPATAMSDSDWWQALCPQPQHVLTASGVRPDIRAGRPLLWRRQSSVAVKAKPFSDNRGPN